MKNPLIYSLPLSIKPKINANIKNNRNGGQGQRHKTVPNRNSNGRKRERREKAQKLVNGE